MGLLIRTYKHDGYGSFVLRVLYLEAFGLTTRANLLGRFLYSKALCRNYRKPTARTLEGDPKYQLIEGV